MMDLIKLASLLSLLPKGILEALINGKSIVINENGDISYRNNDDD